MQPVARESKLAHVEGLRGVAALWVLLYHLWLAVSVYHWAHGLRFLQYGWLGVPLFLAVSGYCLGLPVAAGKAFSIADFARRRWNRIAPTYFVMLALSVPLAFIIRSLFGMPLTWQFFAVRLIEYATFSDNFVFPPGSSVGDLDAPMWTVATEAQIYVLFALVLVPVWRWRNSPATLYVACPLALALAAFTPMVNTWLIIVFCFGLIAADRKAPGWLPWALALVCSFLVTDARNEPEIFIGAATAACLAARPKVFARFLSLPPLQFLGRQSYSLYVIHVPLMQVVGGLIYARHLPPMVAMAMYAIFVPGAIAAGHLLYRATEVRRPRAARAPALQAVTA